MTPSDRQRSSHSPSPDAVAACQPALLRYATLQVRDRTLAEDLVQNALVAGLQALDGFRGEASVLTWLTGILRRQIIDHHRRTAREAPLPDDADSDLLDRLFAADGHWLQPPARWADPADDLQQDAFLNLLEACLKGLAGRSGQVFVMREVLELEAEEICKDLGLSKSNYWVLMHRARLRLRGCVERGWLSFGPPVGN